MNTNINQTDQTNYVDIQSGETLTIEDFKKRLTEHGYTYQEYSKIMFSESKEEKLNFYDKMKIKLNY